jgi:hypothetical protein
MWPGALSIAGCSKGRPLLPLQLVPTRNRQRVRDQVGPVGGEEDPVIERRFSGERLAACQA